MRGAAVAMVLTFSLSTLAGCLAGDRGGSSSPPDVALPLGRENPANDTTPGGHAADPGSIQAPAWNVGDYWEIAGATMHDTNDGPVAVWTNYTAVVVEAGAQGYVVGAGDNRTTYLDGLLIDLLPIGAFDASLRPTWKGAAFPMFQWPLASGVPWSGDFAPEGETTPLAFNVGFDAAVETPYGPRPGFRVSATTNGTLLYAYTYVPAAGWFTLFEAFDEEGSRAWWITVTGWGSGWSAAAYTLRAETLLERLVAYEDAEDPRSPFTVAGEYSYLFVWVHGYERQAVFDQHLVLLGPDNAVRGTYGYAGYRPPFSPGCGLLGCFGIPSSWTHWDTMDATAGEWTAIFETVGAGNLEARFVGVTDVVHLGTAPAAA